MTGGERPAAGSENMGEPFHSIEDVRLIEFWFIADPTGELVPYEADINLPIPIARVFTVSNAPVGAGRGEHAHYSCNQVLVCLQGAVDVVCDDGRDKRTFHLTEPHIGLHVPPSIWAAQRYLADKTCLMVLCDRPYEEADYLRDYAGFLEFRGVTDAT